MLFNIIVVLSSVGATISKDSSHDLRVESRIKVLKAFSVQDGCSSGQIALVKRFLNIENTSGTTKFPTLVTKRGRASGSLIFVRDIRTLCAIDLLSLLNECVRMKRVEEVLTVRQETGHILSQSLDSHQLLNTRTWSQKLILGIKFAKTVEAAFFDKYSLTLMTENRIYLKKPSWSRPRPRGKVHGKVIWSANNNDKSWIVYASSKGTTHTVRTFDVYERKELSAVPMKHPFKMGTLSEAYVLNDGIVLCSGNRGLFIMSRHGKTTVQRRGSCISMAVLEERVFAVITTSKRYITVLDGNLEFQYRISIPKTYLNDWVGLTKIPLTELTERSVGLIK